MNGTNWQMRYCRKNDSTVKHVNLWVHGDFFLLDDCIQGEAEDLVDEKFSVRSTSFYRLGKPRAGGSTCEDTLRLNEVYVQMLQISFGGHESFISICSCTTELQFNVHGRVPRYSNGTKTYRVYD